MKITNLRNRRQLHPESEIQSRINVTPLVDVMLVLLIIFMVSTPLMIGGMDVNLPKTSAKPYSPKNKAKEPLTVSIDAKGNIYIEKTKVSLREISPKIKAIAGQNKNITILIKGDEVAEYQYIAKTLDKIRNAGFHKIALITNPQ